MKGLLKCPWSCEAPPSAGRVLREIARNIDPRSRRNWSCLAMFLWFAVWGPCATIAFAFRHPGLRQWAVFAAYFWCYTVITNTIWWHRFASHRAFSIRSPLLKRLFRISMPIYLPVEAYAIPHRVHHAMPDRPGDPYTPLVGFVACMSTEWTTGVLDPEMTPENFAVARKLIEHTGVPLHDLEGFRRWGTVQTIDSLTLDFLVASVVHGAVGGLPACAALFIAHFFNLEFNYSAHGRGTARHRAGWDFHRDDLSLNQVGPGCLGGEWHNNHHLFPGSMRSGFLPHQIDIPFHLVKAAEACGLVAEVQDHRPRFDEMRRGL